MARILKARYFPESDFLEAKKGSKPSFVWSSMLETQEIIRKGSRWRVGDGESIMICKDNWLPDPHNSKVISPPIPSLILKQLRFLLFWMIKGQSGMRTLSLIFLFQEMLI